MKERDYFDKPENVERIKKVFYACLVVLFIMDFLVSDKTTFTWAKIPGFYALYGFGAYILLVVIARGLRWLLERNEDYYD
jgi:hypothetical protein